MAHALRSLAEAGYGDVVAVPAKSAGARVVRLEVLPGHVAAETPPGGNEAALAALGWRAPAEADGAWRQFFYPQRRRDYRAIGHWVEQILRDAHKVDGPIEVLTRPRAGDSPTVFAGPTAAPTADDLVALSRVESVLAAAGFRVHRADKHVEVGVARRRMQAHLAVSVVRGTVTVEALHLVAPDPTTAAAHLGANSGLDAAPFVYSVRQLADGRQAVCLEAKLCPPPTILALVLWSMIEPLLAAQGRLRSAHRR